MAVTFRRKSRYRRKFRKRKTYRKGGRKQIMKIAQQVVDRNLETKYQDQYAVSYPQVSLTHNVIEQVFDNLTYTQQGVENQPGSKLRSFNRIGSSISPRRLWIKGCIQLSALAPTGFPITKCYYRMLIIRRPVGTDPVTFLPTIPNGVPHNVPTQSQTSLTFAPNLYLTNFDQRVNTVILDKTYSQRVSALTQSQVAPDFRSMGNSVSIMFNLNLNMGKLTRHKVDYSFTDTATTPSGIGIPKKHCFQMWIVPWCSSDYDPSYLGSVRVGSILAQSRLYYKDA